MFKREIYVVHENLFGYTSAEGIRETGLAHNVCLELANKLFNKRRTLYINNFYTSYELAISCLNRKTHVVGTLKNNKKFIPKDILQCKPKKRGNGIQRRQ